MNEFLMQSIHEIATLTLAMIVTWVVLDWIAAQYAKRRK